MVSQESFGLVMVERGRLDSLNTCGKGKDATFDEHADWILGHQATGILITLPLSHCWELTRSSLAASSQARASHAPPHDSWCLLMISEQSLLRSMA